MIGAYTDQAMRAMECPIARTKMGAPSQMCRGFNCPLYREAPRVTSPAWIEAVQRVAAEIDDKTPGRTKAAKLVAADPEAYGLPRLYFCGLGGAPS